MFMSNEPPALPDSSGAIVGRMLPMVMTASFLGREDPALTNKLSSELPGILLWALDGLDRLKERGRFETPTSGEQLLGLLREGASPVMQFVDASCVVGPEHWVSKDELFERWKLWCISSGHEPGSKPHLSRKLFAAYNTKIQDSRRGGPGAQVRGYRGIGLRDDRRATAGRTT